MDTFEKASTYDVSPTELFAWHLRSGAFERLSPPWRDTLVIEREGAIRDGGAVEFQFNVGPVPVRWRARHEGFEEGKEFRDVQERGPFAEWTHIHRFEPADGGSKLTDRIEYRLPAVSAVLGGRKVRDELERLFRFRHERVRRDLLRHGKYPKPPLRVAISGASGLIGTALRSFLSTGGHEVWRLERRGTEEGNEIPWNPSGGELEPASLEGFDAVVCLSGENIGEGRWTESKRKSILKSRTATAGLLSSTIAKLENPPKVFVSASAVGYYNQESTEPQTEDNGKGEGFLAEVCEAWEAACQPARDAGTRVVNTRFGAVLTPTGGALARMLPVFRAGLGATLGTGEQGFSWIGLDDLVGAILFLLYHDDLEGPVNVTAPNPVSNLDFTRTLGSVLHRPTLFWAPSAVIRGLFGAMGDEMLLKGAYVLPRRLEEAGFRFLEPDLRGALRWEMGTAVEEGTSQPGEDEDERESGER